MLYDWTHYCVIELIFARLTRDAYEITSDENHDYNCIAWAAGDTRIWWQPSGKRWHYWPRRGVPWNHSIDAHTKLYDSLGYSVCQSREPEPGWEKVALYRDDVTGLCSHAARQDETRALWLSKLGYIEDIEHQTLDVLEGPPPAYGTVAVLMKRQRR